MPARDLQKEQEQRVDNAIERDPTVIFMLEKMEAVSSIGITATQMPERPSTVRH